MIVTYSSGDGRTKTMGGGGQPVRGKKARGGARVTGRPVVEAATRFAGSGAPRSDGSPIAGPAVSLWLLMSCVPSSCVPQQARRGSTAVVDGDAARRGTMETGCAPRVESRRQVALEEGPWRICKVQRAMCDMRWRVLRESFRRCSGVPSFFCCPVGPRQKANGRVCYGPARAGICLMCWRCLMERANCAWSLGSLVQQRAAWETAE